MGSTFYILTLDPAWLAGIEPLGIGVTYGQSTPGDSDALTVSVSGIDEFTTKEDWIHIWDRYIGPRQIQLWNERGMRPQGRRTVNVERLKKAMGWYTYMVQRRCTDSEVINRFALKHDQETIRRALHDLRTLLTPLGEP